jgi:hypothetical protein
MIDKVRANPARRQAKRLGLVLERSRTKKIHADDLGEYRLVDSVTSKLLLGDHFDASLDEVESYLDKVEADLVAERRAS